MFKMQPQIRYMQIIKNILKKYAYRHGIEATYKGVLDGYCPENSLIDITGLIIRERTEL